MDVSGRLFRRFSNLGAAYELHTLPVLGGSEPVRLSRAQCESLLAELAFVADRLNDPLAMDTAQAVADYIGVRTRQPMIGGRGHLRR